MGRNARLRKLRREMRKQGLQLAMANTALSKGFQETHPDSILFCGSATEKMSVVLQNFADPLLETAETEEDLRRAFLMAMVAWNYTLLDDVSRGEPDAERAKFLSDPVVREVFEFLIARKQQLYPDNRRAILDFELIPNSTDFQFNVISTPG